MFFLTILVTRTHGNETRDLKQHNLKKVLKRSDLLFSSQQFKYYWLMCAKHAAGYTEDV